jgi:hypothetical protein
MPSPDCAAKANPISIFIAALLCAALALAQIGASISGRVEDPQGAAVSGAKVTIRDLETGATRVVTTDDSGNYRALSLDLGRHQIEVEKKGFKSTVRDGINLAVGQEAVANFRLELGEVVDKITVTEEVPVVNTTTAPVSGIVGEREVKDLPLNGRSFDNLITLNPGAVNYSGMKSQNTSTSNGNTFTVAGRRTSENLVLMNGVEYTGSSQLAITPGGVSGELLGIDAVREFNVLTDTYGAEYGKRAGAQVSVVTQSGTNSLHGSMFEFLRNSDLDARNFFDQGFVPAFRRNQFGGALGGPLKKNKWFLFGNYEGFRQSLALSSVSVVPDAQVRQGLLPNSTTGVYAKPANLDPRMLQYMSFWPAANGPELLTNGVASGTALSYNNPKQTIHEDFGTARSDYLIRDGDTLSAAYTIDDGHSLIPLADPLFGSQNQLRNQVASLGLQLRFGAARDISFQHLIRQRSRTRRHRHRRRRHHHRNRGDHFRGTEQRSGSLESAQPDHGDGRRPHQQRDSSDQRRRVVPAPARQRRQRLASTRTSKLHQPRDISRRDAQFVPGGPQRARARVAQPVRRGLRAGFHARASEPDHRIGPALRIHDRMERSCRACFELHYRRERRAPDSSHRGQFGVHKEQCDEAVRSARRSGVGRFRQRQDRDPFRFRHVLFTDRRSGVPAELPAAL